jgi:Protein of unknown function (DUF3306)
MSERENPLLRWARLKQAANDAKEIDSSSPANAPEAPFDLASLPSIEEIVADTDIVAFLRAGVPAELVRAALHRAWTSDPAIRDFIGIAENQWDFNDPNAIPGFGPLAASEDGVDILAQISSRLELPTRGPEEFAAAEPAILSNAKVGSSDEQPAINSPTLASRSAVSDETIATAKDENTPTAVETRKVRRHGGALPH